MINRCVDVFHGGEVEVVLVNNGSTDNSAEVLQKLTASHSFIRVKNVEVNTGYGNGILAGLRSSKTDFLAWTHADMQTDPADILEGLKFFDADNQNLFVKGRRYGRPLMDVVFTIGMSFFETLFLSKTMWDINAQPTIFPRAFFEDWQDPPRDFSLDLYAYYQAKVTGLLVKRFDVRFGERAHGTSHWNISWGAKVKFIKRTLAFSFDLRKKLKLNG